MAKITRNVPTEIIDSYCEHFGYQETITDGNRETPNPQSKQQFVEAGIDKHLRDAAKTVRYKQNQESERKRINQEVDGIGIT